MRNVNRKPKAQSMGVFMWIFPCQRVASHDHIFTPVGTAMMMVVIIIGTRSHEAMPDTNMWCAHTPKPSTAMATMENAIAR